MEKRLAWYQILRRERKLRGWSQAVLAEKIGSDSKTVSRWESKKAFPSSYFCQKLCELFEKNAEELGLIEEDNYYDEELPPVLPDQYPRPLISRIETDSTSSTFQLRIPDEGIFPSRPQETPSNPSKIIIEASQQGLAPIQTHQQDASVTTASSSIGHSQVYQRAAILPAVEREFIGRYTETVLFNDVLLSAKKPILFFHGIGGIGKSWLINRLITLCRGASTALVDFSEASHLDFLTTMIAIRDQLTSKDFLRFNRNLEKYDFIRQAQGVEALKLLKTIDQPVFHKHPSGKEEGLYSVMHYLSVPDIERSRILQEAKENLTTSFNADLSDLAAAGKCVLFFDTVERIDPDTGNWLQKEFLPRLVSPPAKNLLLVLGGRRESLWAKLTREWQYSIEERELTNFNQLEVEEYLINRKLTEPGQMISQMIYKFTAGHPLCVGLAADLLVEYTQQGDELDTALVQAYKWDVNSEIISSFLTQRILDRLPSILSKLIMLCSVTHWFDASIIRHLSDPSEPLHQHSDNYLEAIRSFSFVRPHFKGHRGYTFHEVIRRFLLLKLRRDDPALFRTLNERALQYFEQELEHADARSRSELIVEKVYHLLVVDEDKGMALLSEMFEHFDKLSKKDICRRLIDAAAEHEWDEDTDKHWTELIKMLG